MAITHSQLVKAHFDLKYQDYDTLIRKLIPHYTRLHTLAVKALKLAPESKPHILELGIGTGQTTELLFQSVPNIHITGLDISKQMIAQGKKRLKKDLKNIKFINQDIATISLKGSFSGCIAVLTVHHLNAMQKQNLFRKVYQLLTPGSNFVIGDLVKFPSIRETQQKEALWQRHLFKKLGKKAGQFWFDNYLEEDIPSTIPEHLLWLRAAGFQKPACLWQHLNYAVMTAHKS